MDLLQRLLLLALAAALVAPGAPTTAAADDVVIYTADNAPAAPALEDLPLRESISQHGITWTFAEPARVGQFVSGDYYVVGPVTIADIDPRPLFGDEVGELIERGSVREESRHEGQAARHGSVLNHPVTGAEGGYNRGGFDSRSPSGRYDPELFAHLPIEMNPGDSLISTISRPNDQITRFSGQHVQPIRAAAVLSCLAEPVPADAFRPSYTDSANSEIYLARNLKRELLLDLPRVSGAPSSLESMANRFARPWIDVVDYGFNAPAENMPRYGQQFVEHIGAATLLLHMDYPAEQKEQLLINLTQVGIDLWGVARGGYRWHAHGGLYSGRKWAILFAGLLLGDEQMQSPADHAPNLVFHEDQQTALGPVTYGDETFETSWHGSRSIFLGHSPRLMGERGDSHWRRGWGPQDLYHPTEWDFLDEGGLGSSEGYRRSNTSAAWVAQALAARIMRAEGVWGHDAFFAYVDRWMTQEDTDQVEAIRDAGWRDMTDANFREWPRQGFVSGSHRSWVRRMWDQYRDDLPPAPPGMDGPDAPPADQTWR